MEDDTVTFFSAGGEGGIYLFSFQRTGTWQWWRVGRQDVIYRIQNRAEALCRQCRRSTEKTNWRRGTELEAGEMNRRRKGIIHRRGTRNSQLDKAMQARCEGTWSSLMSTQKGGPTVANLREKNMLAVTYPVDHAGLIMTHHGDCF